MTDLPEDNDDEDLYERTTFRVDPGQQPLRIDKFLQDRLWRVSRSKIQQGIMAGSVKVNEQLIKSNYKVRPGDEIAILIPRSGNEDYELEGENIPLEIMYEDEDLLVVNKPTGMVVHPGIGNRDSPLVNALIYHLQHSDLPVLQGNPSDRPGLVHRIDKDTSGLLVIAKNEFALSHLARQFYEHTTDRTYLALVWGTPDPTHGMIEGHIGRDSKDRTRRRVYPEGEKGKHAITHYKLIEDMYYVSLVECKLETGRTHQIRVHMSYNGHPLFGDFKYGGNQILKGTVFQKYRQFVSNCFELMPHQALHAKSLGFEHPKTGKRMLFEAPLPEGFKTVVEKWRQYVNTRKDLLRDEE
ncbi:MAG: RluA family pseudouridine synthase [Saprospiraceae bacterium]|nr:RluA family pseudouridine synthase [Saprospiraceae bacterium]